MIRLPQRAAAGRLLRLAGLLTALAGLAVWGCDQWVRAAAAGRCHDRAEAVPPMDVALVLGCSPRIQGRPNLFFTHRIEAASALFKTGRVKALLVSGDNGSRQYDEPTAMKAALVAAGVPAERIVCDYAGFRTLDSVVRAREVFGQSRFLVVSQHFHNERAIFLARRLGIEAVGLNAQDVPRRRALTTWLREYLARVQAVLDVTLLDTRPRFAGPPEPIRLP